MKIAITGHRPNKLGNDYELKSPLIQWIKEQILFIITPYGKPTLITGMALGIDTLFARIAIEYNTPFIAAIPCIGHELKWPSKSQNTYLEILSSVLCSTHYVSTEPYNNRCMQDRNIWMVDNCDLLIAVWDGTSGGTANCVRYAQSKNKFIIRIDPKTIEL